MEGKAKTSCKLIMHKYFASGPSSSSSSTADRRRPSPSVPPSAALHSVDRIITMCAELSDDTESHVGVDINELTSFDVCVESSGLRPRKGRAICVSRTWGAHLSASGATATFDELRAYVTKCRFGEKTD